MRVFKGKAWFCDDQPFLTLEGAMEASLTKFVGGIMEIVDGDCTPRHVAKFILANKDEIIRLLSEPYGTLPAGSGVVSACQSFADTLEAKNADSGTCPACGEHLG